MLEPCLDWLGVAERGALPPDLEEAIDGVIDAAEHGDWDAVIGPPPEHHPRPPVNCWRIDAEDYLSPLHLAASSGAPLHVVEALIRLGAWLSLPDAAGFTALDHAEMAGADELTRVLTPPQAHDIHFTPGQIQAMQDQLHSRMQEAIGIVGAPSMRLPEVCVMTEFALPLWVGIPGMYGGFELALEPEGLRVEQWSKLWPKFDCAYTLTPDLQESAQPSGI